MKYPNKKITYSKQQPKLHNKLVYVDGKIYRSIKEYKRACELKLLERAGEITNLKEQVPYVLIDKSKYGRAIKYNADFVYYDPKEHKTIVEDTKGYRTDFYKLKKRLLVERYGIVIKET